MSTSSDLSAEFMKAVEIRRTNYSLTSETVVSDEEVKQILETTLQNAPSTFGSYTTRLVMVVKDEQKRLWDIIIEAVRSAMGNPEKFDEDTKPRLDGFKAGYGTILFFEDPEKTEEMIKNMPFAADKFPIWAQHTSAIHQFIIWTALTNKGLGANLQHYNPLPDDAIKKAFNIPQTYNLVAQLVYGKPSAPPYPKPQADKPLEVRLKVVGA